MAHKKRLKVWQRIRDQAAEFPINPDTMVTCEPIAPWSARPSSEGTMSDVAGSGDEPQTAMTSVVDTEEEMSDTPEADANNHNHFDHFENQDDHDTASVYPVSQYPRTEHFMSGDQRTMYSDAAASTRSLWTQELDYREIHGRRYCRDYFMPNDEIEQLRMTLQHQVLLHVLDNEITGVPLDNPSHILDVGTGTGDWAIRMAELYPDTEVVGTDISAIAETQSVPSNVFFELEDAEEWDRPPDYYDLVHFRWLIGAFLDWDYIYSRAYYSIKPGGWIEVQDFDCAEGLWKFCSQFSTDSPIHRLFRDADLAGEVSGRKRGITHLTPRIFMDAGFVDIQIVEYMIPMTVADNTISQIWLIACLDALEAIFLRLLTQYMGWEPDKCKAAIEEAARELANLARDPIASKGLVLKMRNIVARKPLDSSPPPPSSSSRQYTPSFRTEHITEDSELYSQLRPDRNESWNGFPAQASSSQTNSVLS